MPSSLIWDYWTLDEKIQALEQYIEDNTENTRSSGDI